MKKIILSIICLVLTISFSSCALGAVIPLEGEYEGYYFCNSDGIATITNYHPYNLLALPKYQEMIQCGEGAGLENEGTVYFIYVVDTSMNSENPDAYYCAEFDFETRDMICEEGDYFDSIETKNEAIERLFKALDSIKFR